MNNLVQRIITGSLFVLTIVFVLQLNNIWADHLLIGIITVGCMYEYNRLTGLNSLWMQGASLIGVLMYVFADLTPRDTFSLTGGMGLLLLVVFSLHLLGKTGHKDQLNRIFLGVAYVGFSMHMIHNLLYIPNLLLGLFLLVWTADTGAFVAGKLVGKHKLMPEISPGKTWEGLIGGMLFTAAAAWGLSIWTQSSGNQEVHFLDISPLKALVWGLGVAGFGTLGDLFESRLKREAGVKDSGSILPGHGGFLDRFDAFLFAGLFTQAIFQGPLAFF